MAPAAFSALYHQVNPSHTFPLHTLHNTDMKKLVSILSHYPRSADETYSTRTQKVISKLPSHLRNSVLNTLRPTHNLSSQPKPTPLCRKHKTLNPELIHSIFSAIHSEFEGGLGKFLGPLILHAGLPAAQISRLRVLEPVAQLWDPAFCIQDHTPPGHVPLRPVVDVDGRVEAQWCFQANGCAACMLARIGSDPGVLFALLAGMVGRFPEGALGSRKDVKSRRVRLVRYWVRNAEGGEQAADEAWELGMEMRRVRKALKEYKKEGEVGRGFYGRRARGFGDTGSTEAAVRAEEDFGISFEEGDGSGSGDVELEKHAYAENYRSEESDLASYDQERQPWDPLTDNYQPYNTSNPVLNPYQSYHIGNPHTNPPCRYEDSPSRLSDPHHEKSRGFDYPHNVSPRSGSELSWENASRTSYDTSASEEASHNYRTHGSLVPAPLRSASDRSGRGDVGRDGCGQRAEAKRTNRQTSGTTWGRLY